VIFECEHRYLQWEMGWQWPAFHPAASFLSPACALSPRSLP
jgi:hypothetical protein